MNDVERECSVGNFQIQGSFKRSTFCLAEKARELNMGDARNMFRAQALFTEQKSTGDLHLLVKHIAWRGIECPVDRDARDTAEIDATAVIEDRDVRVKVTRRIWPWKIKDIK